MILIGPILLHYLITSQLIALNIRQTSLTKTISIFMFNKNSLTTIRTKRKIIMKAQKLSHYFLPFKIYNELIDIYEI